MNQIILECQPKFHISWLASKIIKIKKGENTQFDFNFLELEAQC